MYWCERKFHVLQRYIFLGAGHIVENTPCHKGEQTQWRKMGKMSHRRNFIAGAVTSPNFFSGRSSHIVEFFSGGAVTLVYKYCTCWHSYTCTSGKPKPIHPSASSLLFCCCCWCFGSFSLIEDYPMSPMICKSVQICLQNNYFMQNLWKILCFLKKSFQKGGSVWVNHSYRWSGVCILDMGIQCRYTLHRKCRPFSIFAVVTGLTNFRRCDWTSNFFSTMWQPILSTMWHLWSTK